MKPQICVAISGGVDSLMSAFLLKKQFKVVGLHFINGYEDGSLTASRNHLLSKTIPSSTCALRELPEGHPVSHIQDQLKIPIKLVDCRQYFQETVVDYFVESYRKGRTPNPCMICNPSVKFGKLFDLAKQNGAAYFATGHYARINYHQQSGNYFLQKGIDPVKDQSYFLALLPQNVLPHVRFPLGNMTKQQVLAMAKKEGFSPVTHKESQDVCFIQNNNYADFIAAQKGFDSSSGPIVDPTGREIGTHNGLHRFTIGQRRGINCPAKEPYYVVKIDMESNRLIVGFKKDVFKDRLSIIDINWFIEKPKAPVPVFVKIRYRHQAAEATLVPDSTDSATIRFKTPQAAVTPGQGAVCYMNDEVIAGGWIDE